MSKDIQKQFEIKSHHFRCIKRLNIQYFKGRFKRKEKLILMQNTIMRQGKVSYQNRISKSIFFNWYSDFDMKLDLADNELIKNEKNYKIYYWKIFRIHFDDLFINFRVIKIKFKKIWFFFCFFLNFLRILNFF